MPCRIAAGNWKMNGTQAALSELAYIAAAAGDVSCTTILCPPTTLLQAAAQSSGSLAIGGQNCHHEATGAHTGDVSAQMLADVGAQYVIVGHSERRKGYAESDELVQAKARAVLSAEITPIICIGESIEQRESGETISVISTQLSASLPTETQIVVAYEPIWAIGTGLVPTIAQITEVHDALRALLVKTYGAQGNEISILYGGSVKASNASEIFAVSNVNGALVGGASLKAADFVPIMHALSDS
jgi:triosephosphate isomerase